jgi:hypothetical protein
MPEPQHLEQLIHRKLKELPEREAPAGLMAEVMAAIVRRQHLPWYRQPWTEWPKNYQTIFLCIASGFVLALCWWWMPAAYRVSVEPLLNQLQVLGAVPELFESLSRAFLVVARDSDLKWMTVAGVLLALVYLWCVAGGIALFRVAMQKRLRI